MDWTGFHHPDLSLPVIRRRVCDEWLDLLLDMGDLAATRGWSALLPSLYPNPAAYRNAGSRLRKRGVIAYRREGGRDPVLVLTEDGKAQRPPALRPERLWARKWNGIWYLLVYDVPENQRHYRAALRGFLRQMRMGCLQRSVWITPQDIRPDFDDLVKAGGLDSFAFLFESRTVLGLETHHIVHAAWPLDRMQDTQADYCRGSELILQQLRETECSSGSLLQLARLNLGAYLRAMEGDPFLPRALWPANYLGPEALRLHREINREIGSRLSLDPRT